MTQVCEAGDQSLCPIWDFIYLTCSCFLLSLVLGPVFEAEVFM